MDVLDQPDFCGIPCQPDLWTQSDWLSQVESVLAVGGDVVEVANGTLREAVS